MGYRMSFGCGCDEGHYFFELDEDFATTVWMDNHGVLKQLGVSTIPSLAEPADDADGDEDADEGEEQVDLAPEAFLRWLDVLSKHQVAIREALAKRGGHPSVWSAWQDAEFAHALAAYRELAEHARAAGTTIDAGWA
ncbi:MAG: hypothetical protein HZA52_10575 [Planctomycetes bacterium]|nr:hypothetical protein [Planctomycetota bacterium]